MKLFSIAVLITSLFCFSANADPGIHQEDPTINVVEDGLSQDQALVFTQVIVQANRSFSSRNSANNYCITNFGRQGLANFCQVRRNGRNWNADFRVTVRGQGRTFFGAINSVRNFLERNRLLIFGIRLIFNFFNGNDTEQVIIE